MTSVFHHHENDCQYRVINSGSCILGIQCIALILELIIELLTAFIGKNSKYKTKHTNSKIIHGTNCKTHKMRLLDDE